ncbi:MAG: MerR family transcriptional regulator [Thermomicrobiales bacterium]
MIEPEAISDRDYTTQQTADRCGISINTLLSWERRYGVPNPRRNARGERIYRQGDLQDIRTLQAETAAGTPIGVAARRLLDARAASSRPVPRRDDVVVALDITADTALHGQQTAPDSGERTRQQELTEACERLDRSAISALLARYALESDPVLVASAVVVPALRSVADSVESGAVEPVVLDLTTRWLCARLSHWLDVLNPPQRSAQRVVMVVPPCPGVDEVTALAHALTVAREGSSVIDLAPATDYEAIVAATRIAGASHIDLIAPERSSSRGVEARAALLREHFGGSVSVAVVGDVGEPGDAPVPVAPFHAEEPTVSPD